MITGAGAQASGAHGLCPECVHVHIVKSAKGSVFLRCKRSKLDSRWPKYPPQPVGRCKGFEAAPAGGRSA